jgi:hypothetical protein
MNTRSWLAVPALACLAGCAAPRLAPPPSAVRPHTAVASRATAAEPRADAPAPAPDADAAPLPSGWFVPTEIAPLPAGPRPGTFSARRADLAKERRAAPVAFDVASVPVTDVAPQVDLRRTVNELPEGDPAPEVLTVGGRIVVRGRRFGKVTADWDTRPFFAWAEGGAVMHSSHGVKPLEYTTFSAFEGGTAEVEEMQGFYDVDTRRAVALRRVKAKAVALAGGLAYAYRTRCPRCAGAREVLHLIVPDAAWGGPFGRADFDLSERGGGSFLATFSPDALELWKRSGAKPPFRKNTRLGVEVTRMAGEAAPVALLYAGEVTL